MCTKSDCIEKIKNISHYLKDEYGVNSLTLFGSTARGSNKKDSDVDIFIDMKPSGLKIVSLKIFLEKILDSKVDLIRDNSNLDPFIIREIKRDGIRIF